MSTHLRVVSILAGAAILGTLLAGCGGSVGSMDSAAEPASGDSAGGVAADAPMAADSDSSGPETAAQERSMIYRASLRVTAENLAKARQRALAAVTALGGHVADEQTSSDDRGRTRHVMLTLRVPAAKTSEAMDRLAALGTLRSREQSAEDVTMQVIDIDARVKAQTASVASLRRLLDRAGTVADVIAVEKQLSGRQAELDSLLGQQKYLADQTAQAAITLTLDRPVAHEVTRGGFLGGLERGWHALLATLSAGASALGAILPFAVVLAVVLLPFWLLRRRRG